MGTVPLAGGIESSEKRLLDCGQQSSVVGGDGVGQGSFLLRAKTGWPPPAAILQVETSAVYGCVTSLKHIATKWHCVSHGA